MRKTRTIPLGGADTGRAVTLRELAALPADRLARAALVRVDADPAGGVVALALRHLSDVLALGAEGADLLLPFVDILPPAQPGDVRSLDDLQGWRNVQVVQQHALLLHVDFMLGRQMLDIPVGLRGKALEDADPDVAAKFCSPFIAGVLQSDLKLYRDMETFLSTEDVFNMAELLNIEAIRDWQQFQREQRTKGAR